MKRFMGSKSVGSKSVGFKLAVISGLTCLFGWTGVSHAQSIVNNTWENPTDTTDSTSTTATGWTMSPAGTNPGERATFFGSDDTAVGFPTAGLWSFWLQTFEPSGSATQVVTGTTAGKTYNFSSEMLFQLGSGGTQGPTDGYDAVVGLNTFLEMQFEDGSGNAVGAPYVTNIPAGSVTANATFNQYAVPGLAPAGSSQVLLEIGWTGGCSYNGTGSQSGGADDQLLTILVPEPASFACLAIGGLTLLRRRRGAQL